MNNEKPTHEMEQAYVRLARASRHCASMIADVEQAQTHVLSAIALTDDKLKQMPCYQANVAQINQGMGFVTLALKQLAAALADPMVERMIIAGNRIQLEDQGSRVDLSPDEAALLKVLSEEQGVSQKEIVRRALAVEAYVHREVAQGSKLLVQRAGGDIREILLR